MWHHNYTDQAVCKGPARHGCRPLSCPEALKPSQDSGRRQQVPEGGQQDQMLPSCVWRGRSLQQQQQPRWLMLLQHPVEKRLRQMPSFCSCSAWPAENSSSLVPTTCLLQALYLLWTLICMAKSACSSGRTNMVQRQLRTCEAIRALHVQGKSDKAVIAAPVLQM